MGRVSQFFKHFRKKHFSMTAEDLEIEFIKLSAYEKNHYLMLNDKMDRILDLNSKYIELAEVKDKSLITYIDSRFLEMKNMLDNIVRDQSVCKGIMVDINKYNCELYELIVKHNELQKENVYMIKKQIANIFNDIKTARDAIDCGFAKTVTNEENEKNIDNITKSIVNVTNILEKILNKYETMMSELENGFKNTVSYQDSEKNVADITNHIIDVTNILGKMIEQYDLMMKTLNKGFESTVTNQSSQENFEIISANIEKAKLELGEVTQKDALRLRQELGDVLNQVNAQIKLFKRQSYIKHLYHNPVERKALVESFNQVMEDENIKERFNKLIKGLDEESISTVVRIMKRMQMISDGNMALQDIYTKEELVELEKVKDEFTSKIIKIDNDLYYYDGFYLPVNQFDSSVFYSKYGINKLTTLEKIKDKDIIDAGGYVGDTAILLASYTNKKVHVFEAAPDNANIIKETVRINAISNISLIEKALTNKKGELQLSLGERNSCNTLVERPGYNYPNHIVVDAITLDDYVKENNIQVGLIKVDIEGGEQLLIEGAKETIRTQKPILLISIYHTASDFFDIKPMIEEICSDYTFKIVKPVNTAIVMETVLLAEVK